MIQGETIRKVNITGRLEADADALSRNPVPSGEEINEFNGNFIPMFNFTLKEVTKKKRNFVLENSLLYEKRITTNGICLQLC